MSISVSTPKPCSFIVLRTKSTALSYGMSSVNVMVQMIDSGRDCKDVITQLATASRALDRAGFKLIASDLEKYVSDDSEQAVVDRAQLEKLFLALA